MNKQPVHFSELSLEKYVLNELSAKARRKIETEMQTNPRLNEKVKQLRDSNTTILQEYPSKQMMDEVSQKIHLHDVRDAQQKESNEVSKKWIWGPGLAGALALLVIMLLPFSSIDTKKESGLRVKGLSPHLNVYRNTGSGTEKLKPLSLVNAGDIIQLGYVAAGKKYGVIFSLDGLGGITLHFPEKISGGTVLEDREEHLLQTAYELDNAPLFEHFFFVTSDNPIDVPNILSSAQALAKNRQTHTHSDLLDLSKNFNQHSFILKKEKL